MSSKTLINALERAASHPQAGLRFVDRRERETWLGFSQLAPRARRVAGGLAALGLSPGDRVGLVYSTCPEFFEAFFGAMAAGCIPVPLYPPVRLGRLREYHRRTADMLRAVEARIVLAENRVRRILGETMAAARLELGCRRIEDLPEGPPPNLVAGADDLAMIQFSSGTTVDPKPVALSHRAVMSQVTALNAFWPDSADVRHSGLSWLPLYHDMGLIGCVFPALERPSVLTLVAPELFVARPAMWLRAISRYRATISPAPNFAYGLCLEKVRDEELEGVDLSCWRVALNGAEAVSPRTLREFVTRFSRWGLREEALTPVYGLSEATLAVTFSDVDLPWSSRTFDRDSLRRGSRVREARTDGIEITSVGRPLPGFELEIRRGSTGALGEGEIGDLWVRGPSLMTGYFGQAEATKRVLRDGWLDTGDRGFVLDGELFLTGRTKDLIIVRGRNHSPEELEHAVDGIDGVRLGCCAAVSRLSSGEGREEVILFVERRKDADTSADAAVERACRNRVLASAGIEIDQIVILPPGTLPRTSSGKIRRSETLRQFEQDRLAPPESTSVWSLARTLARSSLAYRRTDRAYRRTDRKS